MACAIGTCYSLILNFLQINVNVLALKFILQCCLNGTIKNLISKKVNTFINTQIIIRKQEETEHV